MAAISGQHGTSSIDVDDVNFLATLHTALEEMKLRKDTDLERVAIKVANRAKDLCPVKTGRLRSSIAASPLEHDSQGAYVEVGIKSVGTDVTYAAPVEYGTSKMRQQSFLRPALAEVTNGDFKRLSGPPGADG